jgi:phosphatidyl-myo-inositol alpha-mannosyltransferase
MRVALVCPYRWEATGGVQTHVRQLAAHLRGRGHHTLVLAPGRVDPAEPDVRIVSRTVAIRFNRSVAQISPDPRAWSRVRRELDRFEPDVLHVHEPISPSTSMLATLAAGCPVVATFHAGSERKLAVRLASPVLRAVWSRLDVMIGVSNAALELGARPFLATPRVRVVPNGVDVDLFRGARAADLPPGRRLLFVNRLDPRKGFLVAVDAFAALAPDFDDLWLVVAGDGPERGAVRRLPGSLRERVLMLGAVPHDRLPPYHAAADVFIGPATGGESFGIVLVEAMAAGLPVVASDIEGWREVVRDGVDGLLVPPSDPQALAAAVRRVLGDADVAGRLARGGRERSERYRWETVAQEIEAAYRDAIDAHARV